MTDDRRTMNPDERWCFERLREWIGRFDEVLGLYEPDRAVVPREGIARARELYTKLKADLNTEYRRLNNSRRKQTPAEKQWYARTVHQANASLRAPTNARPEEWHSDLYRSRSDVSSDVHAMKQYFGIAD